MKRLIVEGITGSGKTTLLNCLKDKFSQWEELNYLSLSQFYTNGLIYRKTDSSVEMECYHNLNKICDFIEYFDNGYDTYGTKDIKRRIVSVLECFHIENYAKGYMRNKALFKDLDDKMKNRGYKLIILYLPENSVMERSIISTSRYRNSEKWDNYLAALGKDVEEIKEYFIEIQNEILKWADLSSMDKMIISTEDMDWNTYVNDILKFLEG